MSDYQDDTRLPQAVRIDKLLRKAEATDSPQEAEALTAKAHELAVRHGVTEELLAHAAGRERPDKVIEETITYTGIFHMALFDIGRAVTRHTDCRHLIQKRHGSRTDLIVIGFESDVRRVKALDASVQVQASTAMQRWYRQQDTVGYTPMMKAKMRRQFLMSYAVGLSRRLKEAHDAGIAAAREEEAQRTGDVAGAQVSTDLVLVAKTKRVDAWVDETYGNTLRTIKRNYSSGGYAAANAGYQAGHNADLGQTRIGGKRALGR